MLRFVTPERERYRDVGKRKRLRFSPAMNAADTTDAEDARRANFSARMRCSGEPCRSIR